MVGLADDDLRGLGTALHLDLLLDLRERPPLAAELIRVAVDPLDEQVHDVRHHVRERPGDVVVLPHHHAGQARQRGTAAKALATVETHLVRDAGHARGQVGIAG